MRAPTTTRTRVAPAWAEATHHAAPTVTAGHQIPLCLHARAKRLLGHRYDPDALWPAIATIDTDPLGLVSLTPGRDDVTCDDCREWLHA